MVLGAVIAAVVPLLEPAPGSETFAGGTSVGLEGGAEPAPGLDAAGALVVAVAGVSLGAGRLTAVSDAALAVVPGAGVLTAGVEPGSETLGLLPALPEIVGAEVDATTVGSAATAVPVAAVTVAGAETLGVGNGVVPVTDGEVGDVGAAGVLEVGATGLT